MPEAELSRRDLGRIRPSGRNPPDAVDRGPAPYGGLRRCAPNPPYDRLSRHDLVWLDPTASFEQFDVTEIDRAALRDWLDRRLPLVKGRQDGGSDRLRLGFTLPGIGPRRRIEVRAPRGAILVHGAPPGLAALLRHAPAAWQPRLEALAQTLQRSGLIARVYGSLVTQAFSGDTCLRPDSDIDLLIDCRDGADALAAIDILARHGDASPRLDGEIRMPGGWAVAWRELAQARAQGGQVLAKSDSDLQLMRPEDFLGATLSTGADHGSYRQLRAVPRG